MVISKPIIRILYLIYFLHALKFGCVILKIKAITHVQEVEIDVVSSVET